MTTITLQGVKLTYQGDDVVSVGTSTAVLTMNSANSTFSYSTIGTETFPDVDITDNLTQVYLDGQSADYIESTFSEITTSLGAVTWPGGTTTAFVVAWDTGPNSSTDLIFKLAGASIPPINSVSDWNAFENSITNMGPATGMFAPGQNIKWTEFDDLTLTEDDRFFGTDGSDLFNGGIGDDFFNSSRGNDTYKGGKGFDQVSYAGDSAGVTVKLGAGTATDGFGNTDTLASIEMLRGSQFADTLVGNAGRNIIRGLDGNDTLNGAKGRDEVRYDLDEDLGGASGVRVNLKTGTATDGFGATDTLKNLEDVRGSGSRDIITGSGGRNKLDGQAGNDKLNGLGGKDTLIGGNGKDVLNGGAGDDKLTGGGKADTFVFAGKFGNDTITDFKTAGTAEKIDLAKIAAITGFNDLKTNNLSEVGGNAVIEVAANSITLEGVAMADLSGNDFIF